MRCNVLEQRQQVSKFSHAHSYTTCAQKTTSRMKLCNVLRLKPSHKDPTNYFKSCFWPVPVQRCCFKIKTQISINIYFFRFVCKFHNLSCAAYGIYCARKTKYNVHEFVKASTLHESFSASYFDDNISDADSSCAYLCHSLCCGVSSKIT